MMKTVVVIMADITAVAVDAIVNPANASLLAGSGLCGAIHRKAGSQVTQICQQIYQRDGMQETASVTPTEAGQLSAKYILHAVGPRWVDGSCGEERSLAETYRNIIRTADALRIKNVAIPAISTGIYHFPKHLASQIAVREVVNVLPYCRFLEQVWFVCWEQRDALFYTHSVEKGIAQNAGVMPLLMLPSFHED